MAKNKKSPTVTVNFKGVEGRLSTPADGDYPCRILDVKAGTSSANNEMITVTAEIISGDHKGYKSDMYFVLQDNALWKLHAFLTALGEEVPDDEMDIDLSELIGQEFVGVFQVETYNGKKRAKITDFESMENYSPTDEDEEDEDEKPAPKKKAKSTDEDEDDDEDEDEKPVAKKKATEPVKRGRGRPPKAKPPTEDDEDEDEEDEKPVAKKGKAKPAKKKTWSTEDLEEMDEEELQEVLEEAGLEDDLDLDDYKKLNKKQAAVIALLEEAGFIDD